MEIQYDDSPVAGEMFRVRIASYRGRATVAVYVGGNLLKEKECPDPPCHARVAIPLNARGSTLTVHAQSSSGEKETLQIKVIGRGHATLTAGA